MVGTKTGRGDIARANQQSTHDAKGNHLQHLYVRDQGSADSRCDVIMQGMRYRRKEKAKSRRVIDPRGANETEIITIKASSRRCLEKHLPLWACLPVAGVTADSAR